MRKWDRKIAGFFTLVAAVVLYSTVGVLSISTKATSAARAAPAPAKDDLRQAMIELQEATHEYYDHPRAAKVLEFIDQQNAQVRELAKSAPDDRRAARVIFRRALNPKELDAMCREFHLSVNDVRMIFGAGGAGQLGSTLPMQILWRSHEPLVTTVDRFIADNRAGFKLRAAEIRKEANPQTERVAAHFDQLAKDGKPALISVAVIGKADMLRLVSEEPDVYAVLMDKSPETVQRLDEARRHVDGATAIQDVSDRRTL